MLAADLKEKLVSVVGQEGVSEDAGALSTRSSDERVLALAGRTA